MDNEIDRLTLITSGVTMRERPLKEALAFKGRNSLSLFVYEFTYMYI
jgi:hypothetical protein